MQRLQDFGINIRFYLGFLLVSNVDYCDYDFVRVLGDNVSEASFLREKFTLTLSLSLNEKTRMKIVKEDRNFFSM